ncbi:hypothetical protein BDZ88DRAFT_484375 [Geranomyces variabilis]|nr:hypothetical protein BDZ88DRAFT_484375 [Geranomyces variabilis]KAJ3142473.1 hypothetical protein HDU90_004747 [Geranomyces variabilis]
MLTKSLSFAVVGLAAFVVAQQPGLSAVSPQLPTGFPTPAGFPANVPASIPTGLPPGVPSARPPMPGGNPYRTATDSGGGPICAARSAIEPSCTPERRPCANQGVAVSYLKPALSRFDADAAFQNIGKCVCTNIAAMGSQVQEYVTGCPTKESADVGKYREACKSNDLMRVAAQMQITLKDGTTGTICTPSQSTGSLVSKNTVALAGLAAFGFALLI